MGRIHGNGIVNQLTVYALPKNPQNNPKMRKNPQNNSKMRKKYSCSACARLFATENSVWTHIAFKHPGVDDVQVQLHCCGCLFSLAEDYDEHVATVHNAPQLDTLAEATILSSNDAAVTKNQLVRDSIQAQCRLFKFICSLCRKKFTSENALWTHAAFSHAVEAAANKISAHLSCDSCKVIFSSRQLFDEHTRRVPQVVHPPSSQERIGLGKPDLEKTEFAPTNPSVANLAAPKEDADQGKFFHSLNDLGAIERTDSEDESASEMEQSGSSPPSSSVEGDEDSEGPEDSVDDRVPGDDDPFEDKEVIKDQIALLSYMLTNQLLTDRVHQLEEKVTCLQEYMKNLVDGLLLETVPEASTKVAETYTCPAPSALDHTYSQDSVIIEEFLEPLTLADQTTDPGLPPNPAFPDLFSDGIFLEVCREETVVDTPLLLEDGTGNGEAVVSMTSLGEYEMAGSCQVLDEDRLPICARRDEECAKSTSRRKIARSRALPSQEGESSGEVGRNRSQSRPTALASA